MSLGNQYLASNFAISEKFPMLDCAIPLDLVRCDVEKDEAACGLVQLRHTVPPNLMYSSYGYRSGVNETMTRHLKGIVDEAVARVGGLGMGNLVLDIGANDGTLLKHYVVDKEKQYYRVGFEPSNIQPDGDFLKRENRKPTWTTYVRDYFSEQSYAKIFRDASLMWSPRTADIITSIAMFYDLEDPNRFVKDVAAVLAPKGIWVFEMSYMPSMLRNASFDTVCHEHLEYYSLSVIERLLHKHGLTVVDATLNDANGGSIRITAAHAGAVMRTEEVKERIYDIQRKEFEMGLHTSQPYTAFEAKVLAIRNDLGALLLKLRGEGKKIYGYGASTKGNVILQYCGITPDHITAIADRNPQKVGTKTIGTNITIVSEDEMRAAKPDYLLVLPWHFMDEFRRREEAFVARGGKFIVPVPAVKII